MSRIRTDSSFKNFPFFNFSVYDGERERKREREKVVLAKTAAAAAALQVSKYEISCFAAALLVSGQMDLWMNRLSC